MTEPKSLREEFVNKRIAVADKYLNELADNFEERLKKAPLEKCFLRINGYNIVERCAVFAAEALAEVTEKEAHGTQGYARLKEICARPEVDMCLGVPANTDDAFSSYPKKAIVIFVERPYADSKEAANIRLAAERLAGEQKDAARKGFFKRIFSRKNPRRSDPPYNGGVYFGGPTPEGTPPVPAVFLREALEKEHIVLRKSAGRVITEIKEGGSPKKP